MTNCNQQIQIIQKLSRSIAKASAPEHVYQLIIDELSSALGVDRASLMVYDDDKQGLVIAAAKGMDKGLADRVVVRLGEGISGKVFAGRKPLMLDDIKAEQRGAGKYKSSSLMSAPVMCSPLKMGEEPLGVINVTDRKDKRPFSKDDLDLLTIVADVAASYVHLTRLAKEVGRTQRLRQELEIARNIQYRLLPSRPPSVSGIDVAGRCLTAERVGGDYYDYFVDRKPTFVVADVSGHSIGAALIMAAFRAAIRPLISADGDISKAVENLNRVLYEDLFQAEQFVSLVVSRFDEKKRELEYLTAGHPPIFVWKAKGHKVQKVWTQDPLIGIEPRSKFSCDRLKLDQGDVVLMYSDGLIEAPNNRNSRFGTDRLEEALRKLSGKGAAGIVEDLVSMLLDFIHPVPLRDDVSMIVLKCA